MPSSGNNIVVVYNSKYGSTRRYAEWIAAATQADLLESSKAGLEDLLRYQAIVYGGSLHAVGIKGVKLITGNFGKLKDKRLIVFCVGASPAQPEAVRKVREHNFTREQQERIGFFFLRGAFNYDKLSAGDKILMGMLKASLKMRKEEDLDEDSKGLLACYDKPADWTDPKAVDPIIELLKSWT